jgi:hypothetical protein
VNRSIKYIISPLFLLLLLVITSGAEEAQPEETVDLSGTWVVLLTNSLSRKQVTFNLNQKDGRLRGTVSSSEIPEQKLDGRLDKGNKFKLWGTYYERTGASTEYQFHGTYEGEPGEETLKGESEFFKRRYDFVGERAK